jgi:predicted TIM-barrel fold metal-dependent hydrolase
MRIDLHAHLTPSKGQDELLAAMDEMRIDASVLSAPGISNEELAELVRERPTRLGGMATVPLPDVDGAIDTIDYALDVLKLDGVRLQTNYDGIYVSDPRFVPFLEELDRRGAYVMLHPAPPPHELSHRYPAWAFEYPQETTRAVAGLLFSGALGRYRRLRLQLSHLGGTLPFLADRLSAVQVREPDLVEPDALDVRGELSRLYYDTAQAFAPGPVALVTELAGRDHIVYGTDWPFDPLAASAPEPSPELAENAAALVPRLH